MFTSEVILSFVFPLCRPMSHLLLLLCRWTSGYLSQAGLLCFAFRMPGDGSAASSCAVDGLVVLAADGQEQLRCCPSPAALAGLFWSSAFVLRLEPQRFLSDMEQAVLC